MADDNVFSADPLKTPADEGITADILVGEGKKYASADELAKAYANADSFIETLKREKAEQAAELKVLRDLSTAQKPNENPEGPQGGQPKTQSDPAPKQEVDLTELVRKEMQAMTEQERSTRNVNETAERLASHYGSVEKANAAVHARAKELGVGVEWLRDAAARSPSAFYASMGINTTDQRSANSPFSQNDAVIRQNGAPKRDFRFYEELRKNQPKAYFSQDVQKQLLKDAREPDFYNTPKRT